MKASPSLTLIIVAGGVLLGINRPSEAAKPLLGGYSEASTTNEWVAAAAQFAAKALAAMPERMPVITLVEILSASQQVVAGMNYRLRLKLKVDGKEKEVDVVVWRKLNGEYQLTSRVWINQPDEGVLSRLRKGMLLTEFEQVVGKSAKPRPNPAPHDSVADYDFDGWCIIADLDNSPVAPAATVRDYRVVRDGLTTTQREAERTKKWAAWVEAHPRTTTGQPNPAENGVTNETFIWKQDKVRTATGVLAHFPSNVRSAQAWYGHNFMVGGIPVKPTVTVPEPELIKHIGKKVTVSGVWNPGVVWKPTDEERNAQHPVNPDRDTPTVRGDGIMVERMEVSSPSGQRQ